jgi:hypothetical protein
MDENKKRILFAIGFIILCIVIGYLLYWVFFGQKTNPEQVTPTGTDQAGQFPTSGQAGKKTTVTPTGQLPTSKTTQQTGTAGGQATTQTQTEKKVNQPISNYVVSAASDLKGGSRFYNDTDGKFYRLQKDGTVKEMSDQVFYNVQKATWSPAANQAIIEYPDGSNIYYDFDSKKQVSLPKHWESFSFSSQGDKIAAKSLGLSPENRWLITADPDGKNISLIEPMGDNADKVTIDWSPNQQVVALSRTGEALGADREEVLFVGLHGENFKSTVVEGRGLQSQWSTTGKNLLYSVYSARSDFKPELWIVNAEGGSIGANRRALSLNTWAEKCTFQDERTIYCAVPIELNTGAGFAPSVANSTPDTIYKIDLQTGLKTEIKQDNENHTVNNMFVGSDGKKLYFTDKNQNGLFSINL